MLESVAAFAERLARFRVHRDRDVGVNDPRLAGERRIGLEFGLDKGGVADQQEARVGMAHQRNGGGRNDHARTVVPAHGVERYGDWSTHSLIPIRKTIPMRHNRRGNPRK